VQKVRGEKSVLLSQLADIEELLNELAPGKTMSYVRIDLKFRPKAKNR
jgi:hypothetical protein